MLWVPVPITLGVYVDVHVAGLLALSVHAVNVPVPLLAGVIVPPGALLVPLSVSVTVTVQVVESFTGIDPGAQRSEERRVGKERRSRWSPAHYKKKIESVAA